MVERYFIFQWPYYDECGGMYDFVGAYDSLEDAEAAAQKIEGEYFGGVIEVWDMQSKNKVWSNCND